VELSPDETQTQVVMGPCFRRDDALEKDSHTAE
jgi:hypothetical protein